MSSVTTRDRDSRHRAVRDAAATQVTVTADQESVGAATWWAECTTGRQDGGCDRGKGAAVTAGPPRSAGADAGAHRPHSQSPVCPRIPRPPTSSTARSRHGILKSGSESERVSGPGSFLQGRHGEAWGLLEVRVAAPSRSCCTGRLAAGTCGLMRTPMSSPRPVLSCLRACALCSLSRSVEKDHLTGCQAEPR
jgi:hypothetical protein